MSDLHFRRYKRCSNKGITQHLDLCDDSGLVATFEEYDKTTFDKIADLLIESGWRCDTPNSRWMLTYTDSQGDQREEVGGARSSAVAAAYSIKNDTGATVTLWRKGTAGNLILEDRI